LGTVPLGLRPVLSAIRRRFSEASRSAMAHSCRNKSGILAYQAWLPQEGTPSADWRCWHDHTGLSL